MVLVEKTRFGFLNYCNIQNNFFSKSSETHTCELELQMRNPPLFPSHTKRIELESSLFRLKISKIHLHTYTNIQKFSTDTQM